MHMFVADVEQRALWKFYDATTCSRVMTTV